MIYVAQASIGGPVKIGYTSASSVAGRIEGLQCGCPWPLIVIRTMPGTGKDERGLHDRFAAHRLHGEWFAPEGAVLDWLQGEHALVRGVLMPAVGPIVAGLPERPAALSALLTSEWQRTSVFVAATGLRAASCAAHLRTLREKYGLAMERRVAVDGRYTSEWRSVWVSSVSHTVTTENEGLGAHAA